MKFKSMFGFIVFMIAMTINFETLGTTMGSSIPLDDAYLRPGQSYELSLDKLYDNVKYKLYCIIKYKTLPTDEAYSDILLSCPPGSQILKEDVNFGECSYNKAFSFKTDGTRFSITKIGKFSGIQIRNLDYTNSILVSCVAKIT